MAPDRRRGQGQMRSRLRNDYDYCRNQASLYIQVVSLRSPQSLRNETFFLWHPGGRKSLYHVTLDPPGHRADEASRRRRVCRTDFQDLSQQCRIVWNPVSHHDAPAGPRHRTISLATSKGLGANIAPKMVTTRSKLRSLRSCRLEASPS